MPVRRPLIIAAVVAAVVIFATSAYVAVADSTVFMDNPTLTDKHQYSVDVQWPGIADASVHGDCPTVKGHTTCDLSVLLAVLWTPGGPNGSLATRSITLKLNNAWFSQLAIASGINVPTAPLLVSYVSDNNGGTSATIYTPILAGGGTWSYDFVIINPSMSSGNTSLDLILSAHLIPTGFLGHSYDLQSEIHLPSQCTILSGCTAG